MSSRSGASVSTRRSGASASVMPKASAAILPASRRFHASFDLPVDPLGGRIDRGPRRRRPPPAALARTTPPATPRGRPPPRGEWPLQFRARLRLPAALGDSHMTHIKPPQADGLYDPRFEHDACGVAMVARLDNEPTHEVVARALEALDNLEHRGAEGADVRTGDGAGILTQMPDAFFRGVVDFELPPAGRYGVGVLFLPHDPTHREQLEQLVERNVRAEGQELLGWRDVPIDEAHVGESANACRPFIRQVFVGAGAGHRDDHDA